MLLVCSEQVYSSKCSSASQVLIGGLERRVGESSVSYTREGGGVSVTPGGFKLLSTGWIFFL